MSLFRKILVRAAYNHVNRELEIARTRLAQSQITFDPIHPTETELERLLRAKRRVHDLEEEVDYLSEERARVS